MLKSYFFSFFIGISFWLEHPLSTSKPVSTSANSCKNTLQLFPDSAVKHFKIVNQFALEKKHGIPFCLSLSPKYWQTDLYNFLFRACMCFKLCCRSDLIKKKSYTFIILRTKQCCWFLHDSIYIHRNGN